MKLKGVLDFSLGNFLCLRGFAQMGDLYDISEPDPGYQRNLLVEHEAEMLAFLKDAEFLFFPEVILATVLSPDETGRDAVIQLYENVRSGNPFANLKFPEYRIACKVQKSVKRSDNRSFDLFQTGTLEFNGTLSRKFSRIDGNHRLSATPKEDRFRSHNTPFCLLLFRSQEEADRFSRVLFHNINYKAVPLTMEQNLKLILDDSDLFPDDKLKEQEFFGWPYYHARKVYARLADDMDFVANLRPFIESEPRTFLLKQFKFLIDQDVLDDNENAVQRYRQALGRTNSLFDAWPQLKDSTNRGLLATLIYFDLKGGVPITSFVRWVLENHLHLIEESNAEDLIAIYGKVLASRARTIFVSMPFGNAVQDSHFSLIQRVAREISDAYSLKPAIKVERVDWFHDGTSYVINDKIIEMMDGCGLLIGNLTYCNPNVYHEIGFVMGKAKALGKDCADMLLFLDESVSEEKDRLVGFNLYGIKQLRFTAPETQFVPALRENLEKYFRLA